ncbi:MAG TPA: DUF6160 family protein [Noviherbaspirillum sp.]|uniref:DUF6160 family protein n=1 Tax=Noviherbaspirillum sp. TaxID=1926288 RepID=UPI002D44BF38|nr:DUF6160 family protein [Noviherbaspirillum sp.]HYD93957.1 DUF6160 family protein [Noviherbaspirillum sp.]
MKPTSITSIMLRAALALCTLSAAAGAQAMQPLSDSMLSSVEGRDGMSFDLSKFAMSGNARYTYYEPGPSGGSAWVGNYHASRSDDPSNEFGDPYRLDILAGTTDYFNLAFPENANGAKRWQAAYDWGVNANGISFEGGSVVVRDAVFYGGGWQWGTPRVGEGFAFGLGLRMEVGNILLRPRGRDDISAVEPASVTEQMNLRGLRIGAVDANGNFTNAPWQIADVRTQPGIFNAVTDSAGNARLHLGIDWPDANGAPLGGLQIDNLSFRSGGGTVDLGSSRIGSMQIQYLDVKFKP